MLRNLFELKLGKDKEDEVNNIFMLFYDFRDAFGSVDHEVLWQILDWFHVPRYLQNIVKDAYKGSRFCVRYGAKGEVTPWIMSEKGVRQGCTASPYVFCIVEDLLLRVLDSLEHLEIPGGVPVNATAFADDATSISDNKGTAQLMVHAVEFFCNTTGMETNVKKSAATVVSVRNGKRIARDPGLFYQQKPFTAKQGADRYIHHGVEVGGTGSSFMVVNRLEVRMEEKYVLYQSLDCPGWMKSIFFITVALPYVFWTLSIWTLPVCQLKRLDDIQRKVCRQFEGLRGSTCGAAIHAPNALGGYGFLSMELIAPLRFTVPFLRRLFLADPEARGVQWAVLAKEAKRLCTKIQVTTSRNCSPNPHCMPALWTTTQIWISPPQCCFWREPR
jgi:hypothetical protein